MDDAIAVALELRPDAARLLRKLAPAGLERAHGERRQALLARADRLVEAHRVSVEVGDAGSLRRRTGRRRQRRAGSSLRARAPRPHSRSDEVAGLDRGRPNARHSEPQLWREAEPARAARERPTSGDEAQGREEPDADPHRRPKRSEQRDRDRGGQREADEQAPAVARRPSAGRGSSPARRRERRIRARAPPRRSTGRTSRRGARPRRRARRPSPRTRRARRPSSARRPAASEPSEARLAPKPAAWPAAGAGARSRRRPSQTGITSQASRQLISPSSPDERHSDDPRERRPEQRQRQHAGPVDRRRPLGGGGDRGRVRHADPETDEHLRDDEHREVGRRAADQRADREGDERAEHEPAQADPRSPGARSREPRRRPRAPTRCAADRQSRSRRRDRCATSGRSGFRTTSAACDAASAASSAMPTARGPYGIR